MEEARIQKVFALLRTTKTHAEAPVRRGCVAAVGCAEELGIAVSPGPAPLNAKRPIGWAERIC